MRVLWYNYFSFLRCNYFLPMSLGSSFRSGMPILEPDDSEYDDIHAALDRAMRDHEDRVVYLAFPDDYDRLMEMVNLSVQKLQQNYPNEEIRIGIRTSCEYDSVVVVVYVSGSIQYHINSYYVDDFDIDTFKSDIVTEYDIGVFDIDEYLTE